MPAGYPRRLFLLTASSAILFGVSFPPIPTGILALVAFVPFFLAFEDIDRYGQAIRYFYLWMIIIHVITVYWTGGFTHGRDGYLMMAGAALVLIHPLFYLPAIVSFVFFRKHFGYSRAVILFPLLWVGMEYLKSVGEYGFPWLTFGNTQTYDLSAIQLASFTGVYGISFWLLWLNVLIYFLYKKIAERKWRLVSIPSCSVFAAILLLYFIPKIYGYSVLKQSSPEKVDTVAKVGIVQANIDPFEKWTETADRQLAIHQELTNDVSRNNVDLILWSETAVPFYLLTPANRYYFDLIKRQVDSLRVSLLTGIPDIIYYRNSDSAPKSSKVSRNGERYDSFNSSMLLRPLSDDIQKYAKILLVPYAERVPYSEQLSFLNAMQWNFGLGGWGIGRDTVVFTFATRDSHEVKFSNFICYESVYPGFVAAFVRKGAQFLTVITNDSWWGNTSGAYQHKQFAVLRAVENRRWVARCANGGVSCFIDPYGRTVQETQMYMRTTLVAGVRPRTDMTFYSLHGDWLAESCLTLVAMFLMAGFGKKVYKTIRMREELARS